jgi:N-acetyl-anhydromuramyl-L-alanine amidase AmpD
MKVARILQCPNHNALTEPRRGIMLHFDGSAGDAGAQQWFLSPACKVSYNWLVLDNGDVVEVVPAHRRAWHAGKCRPRGEIQYRDANSAFWGLAVATNEKVPATAAQVEAVAAACRHLFDASGWRRTEGWRIRGHDEECYPIGRKIDPTGPDAAHPILSVADVRSLVSA